MNMALSLSEAAVSYKKNVKIHIKIDTGMSRIGYPAGYTVVKEIIKIGSLPGITIEGMYTHFASADEADRSYTLMQFEKYMSICAELARIGIFIPVKHVCNSAGILGFPEMYLDAVRPGIMMYGCYPSEEAGRKALLKPAMTLCAKIMFVKDVGRNTYVGYGRKFKTKRITRLATVPVGYADGYPRNIKGKGRALVQGQFVPIVGTVCMDMCMVDVTDIGESVHAGDEVVLFGSQLDRQLAVEEVSVNSGTISYETVCSVSGRVPRVYVKSGKIQRVRNFII